MYVLGYTGYTRNTSVAAGVRSLFAKEKEKK